MTAISIIGCVVGIVGCFVGVATFISAQITRAKQDGMLIAKVDQCVQGIEDIKKDMKEKNSQTDKILNQHATKINTLEVQMKTVLEHIDM